MTNAPMMIPAIQVLERGRWFDLCLLSQISEILTANSRTNEPIPGMFVLIQKYFSWW